MISERDLKLIDDFDSTGTGWARFSADRKCRFRLARALVPWLRFGLLDGNIGYEYDAAYGYPLRRVVFVMLNPSTADAFILDPTIQKCVKFARRWDGHLVEVVNIFAYRSPYPADLKLAIRNRQYVGNDEAADRQILEACMGAHKVIAAWGNDGVLADRGAIVKSKLLEAGVKLHHLGLSMHGQPKHPLARGKHLIPIEQEPALWA